MTELTMLARDIAVDLCVFIMTRRTRRRDFLQCGRPDSLGWMVSLAAVRLLACEHRVCGDGMMSSVGVQALITATCQNSL